MTRIPAIILGFATACAPTSPGPDSAMTCESGFIQDGSVCVPASCGTGLWGNLPVDDDTVYVDMVAGEGGDGTEATPYATIQRGLDRAEALGGGLVAVAAGTYQETLELTSEHADIHLAGRCQEMVTLDASVGDEETPGIRIDVGDAVVDVAGVTVRQSSYVGLWVESGEVAFRSDAIVESRLSGLVAFHPDAIRTTDLLLEDVLISGNAEFSIWATDSDTYVTLRDTIVRDSRPDANGKNGLGIAVDNGATLSSEGCLIEGNTDYGVFATDPDTRVTLNNTIIRDTRPTVTGESGRGIEVNSGATLAAVDCLIEGNSDYGVFVGNPDTHATLRNTTIRSTKPTAKGESGRGIEVNDGAILALEDCLIEGNTDAGLSASDSGTTVILVDTTIMETQPDVSAQSGRGISVSDGATLSAKGCLIDGNTSYGVLALDPITRIALHGTTVSDTRPDANGALGRGIHVQDGATLSAEDCVIERNTDVGIVVSAPGSQVTLVNSTVRDTLEGTTGAFGRGIQVQDGAILFARDCLVFANTEAGLVASNLGTQVILVDTTVADTHPNSNGEFGRGIEVHQGAMLSAEGCSISGSTEIGLSASGIGTQVALRDTTVMDTQPNANGESGHGIGVQYGATFSAVGCIISGNAIIGVVAMDPGTQVTLVDTTVKDTWRGTSEVDSVALGVTAQDGASVSAFRLVVRSNEGPGLLANGDGAILECSACIIEDNQFAGAAALQGGTLSISDSAIQRTGASVNLLGGAGIYTWPWNGGPPALTLTNTLVLDNPIAGVWMIGTGSYILTGNTISGGTGEPFGSGSRCGDAVLARDLVAAWDGTSGLFLQDNLFQDASGAGVFLNGSSALMSGNEYGGNAMDLVVQDQSCDALPEWYSEAPQRDLCPLYSYPTCHAEFFFKAMPASITDDL